MLSSLRPFASKLSTAAEMPNQKGSTRRGPCFTAERPPRRAQQGERASRMSTDVLFLKPKQPLPYTAQLPCLLRGSLSRFRRCPACFYAIGKIQKNGWRADFNVSMPSTWEEYLAASPYPSRFGFDYCGPFFVACDHGCSHRNQSHATAACGFEFHAAQVFAQSERQIQQAGFVLVWAGIDGDALDTAYGSLVELGIAHALHKPILLAHHPDADLRPFWFSVEAATAVVCAENPSGALELLQRDWRCK